MKNESEWRPSKYVFAQGQLKASRDTNEVGTASRLITDLIAARYQQHIKQFAKGRLLDLGCGQAPLYSTYRDLVSEVTCVDWENSLHKKDYLDFKLDLTKKLPFETEAFDTLILSDVLEHIPNPEDLWSEMARILSPGGTLLMNTPFLYWLHEVPFDFYRYTEHALRRFAEQVGLQVIILTPIGGAPESIADLLSKNLLQLRAVGGVLASSLQGITGAFVRTRLGQKASEKTCQSFPLGYFLVAQKPLTRSAASGTESSASK